MSKSSCIQHPKREPLVIIRRWQLQFCKGNKCAAALLNFYEYWHNIKLDIQLKNIKANDIAENHGDKRWHDESLLQFHTLDELVTGINELFSKNTISAANQFLKSLNVISIYSNPNPKYTFDRTQFILFHPEVCNQWLEKHSAEKNTITDVEQSAQGNGSIRQDNPESLNDVPELGDRSRNSTLSNLNEVLLSSQPDDFDENQTQIYRDTKMGSRSPNSALSNPKIGTRYPKIVTPCPKIGKYNNDKEITSKITTKKAAAEESVQTTDVEEATNNPVAAAFSFCDVETTIQGSLTANQWRCIGASVDTQLSVLKNNPALNARSLEEIQRAIALDIQNPQAFKKSHPNFLHKLNAILREAKRGRWAPSMATHACQAETDSAHAIKEKKLIGEIEALLRERQAFYLDLEKIKQLDQPSEELIFSFGSAIKKIDEQLKPLMATMDDIRCQSSHEATT